MKEETGAGRVSLQTRSISYTLEGKREGRIWPREPQTAMQLRSVLANLIFSSGAKTDHYRSPALVRKDKGHSTHTGFSKRLGASLKEYGLKSDTTAHPKGTATRGSRLTAFLIAVGDIIS